MTKPDHEKTPEELLRGAQRSWRVSLPTEEGPIETVVYNERTHLGVERPSSTPSSWGPHAAWDLVVSCLRDGRLRLKGIEHFVSAEMIPVRTRGPGARPGINLPAMKGPIAWA